MFHRVNYCYICIIAIYFLILYYRLFHFAFCPLRQIKDPIFIKVKHKSKKKRKTQNNNNNKTLTEKRRVIL